MPIPLPTTPDVLLLAVQDRLKTKLIWPLERLYIAAMDAPPINAQADQYLIIRMTGLKPVASIIHGAGRLDYRVQMSTTITLSTRCDLDEITSQQAWLTDKSLGHIKFLVQIIDALGAVYLEDAQHNGLCYEDIILESCNVPEIDRKATGWGQSAQRFSLDFTLALDQTVQ